MTITENNYDKNHVLRTCTIIIVFVSLLFYIMLPLEEDQRSSIACAQQGEYFSNFPQTISDSYHLRGYGHKLLNYVFYKVTSSIIGTSDKFFFEILFKCLTSTFYLAVLWLAVNLSSSYLRSNKLDPVVVFGIATSAFITTSSEIHFQAEEISALLVILGLAMSLNQSSRIQMMAGLPLALTFSMKGVTLAIGAVGVIAQFAINPEDRKSAIRFALSYFSWSMLIIAATIIFIPQELIDLRNTAYIEGIQFDLIDRLRNTANAIRGSFDEIPIVISSLFISILILTELLSNKNKLRLILYLSLWLAPIVPAFIQGKGFAYHLSGFIIPALLTVYGLYYYILKIKISNKWCVVTCCAPTIICWLFTSPLAIFGDFNYRQIIRRSVAERSLFSEWNVKYGLSKQSEITYLAAGDAAYYAEAKSSLRYFVPIAIQRIERNPKLVSNVQFQEDMNKILISNAPYWIVDEKWFEKPFQLIPDLKAKLDNDYLLVDKGCAWSLYQRKSLRN